MRDGHVRTLDQKLLLARARRDTGRSEHGSTSCLHARQTLRNENVHVSTTQHRHLKRRPAPLVEVRAGRAAQNCAGVYLQAVHSDCLERNVCARALLHLMQSLSR